MTASFMKGGKIMSYKEERHLEKQIRTFEDILLRSKSMYEIEQIRVELSKMRARLQNMKYQASMRRS